MNGSESATPSNKQSGLFEDLIEVLYSPSAVFERTRARGAMTYILVTAAIAAVIMFGTKSLVGPWYEAQAELGLKLAAAQGKQIPEAAAASARTFSSWGIVIGLPVVMLVGPAVNALFMMLGGKLVGARASFSQLTTVATLAGIPRLLGVFAMPAQAALMNGESARSLADLSLGPARFIDPASLPASVMTLVSNFDVFRIWQLALITIGVAVVAKVSKGTAIVVTLIMFALSVMFQLLPTALT